MKIDFAFERIDHLLRNGIGDFGFVGRAEKRNAHFAALELDAALERDVGLDGAKSRGAFSTAIDRQNASGGQRAVKITCAMHLQPAQAAIGCNAGLNEAAGRQPQQRPRRRVGLRKAQRGSIADAEPAEQRGERLATLHAQLRANECLRARAGA